MRALSVPLPGVGQIDYLLLEQDSPLGPRSTSWAPSGKRSKVKTFKITEDGKRALGYER
jgi:hypothetical protein